MNIRQGMPVTKEANGDREAGNAGPVRQRPLFVGRRICPSSVDRPNGKRGARHRAGTVWSGERLPSPPARSPCGQVRGTAFRRYFAGTLQGEIRLTAVNRCMLLPICWADPRDTLGTYIVLTREGLTTSHALQHWGRQDAANRWQQRAVLEGSTRPPPLPPDDASPAPAQLSTAAITLLETYGRVKGYHKNAVLIYTGTPSPACYVVLSGRVRGLRQRRQRGGPSR